MYTLFLGVFARVCDLKTFGRTSLTCGWMVYLTIHVVWSRCTKSKYVIWPRHKRARTHAAFVNLSRSLLLVRLNKSHTAHTIRRYDDTAHGARARTHAFTLLTALYRNRKHAHLCGAYARIQTHTCTTAEHHAWADERRQHTDTYDTPVNVRAAIALV